MLPTNTTLDTIRHRRSVRAYTTEAVSRDDLMTILDAGRWAPSGLDNQPFRFILLRGDNRQNLLSAHTHYKDLIQNAGALIVVCIDKTKMYNAMKDHQSAGACIQNMLLAIHSLGLGAVWIGQIVNQAPDVLNTLNLDAERYELMAVIALGHPAETPERTREPLESMLLSHSNDYNQTFSPALGNQRLRCSQ